MNCKNLSFIETINIFILCNQIINYIFLLLKSKEVIGKAIKNFLPKNGYILEIGIRRREHGGISGNFS